MQWKCPIRILSWENRVSGSTFIALALMGATLYFGIGWDYLNVLTISRESKASSGAYTGILKTLFFVVCKVYLVWVLLSFVTSSVVMYSGFSPTVILNSYLLLF